MVPPPPPPSASYLLVLDSDSDSESESEDNVASDVGSETEVCRINGEKSDSGKWKDDANVKSKGDAEEKKGEAKEAKEVKEVSEAYLQMVAKIKSDLAKATGLSVEQIERMRTSKESVGEASASNIASPVANDSTSQELDDDDNDNDDDGAKECADRKKKKKRKKKRSKKKKKSHHQLSKSVSFGDVSVREHRRIMGQDVVPTDGGWPLGLSNEVVRDYTLPGTVDDFEHRRQQELKQRYIALLQEHSKSSKSNPKSLTLTDAILETRQFDYKKKPENNHAPDPNQQLQFDLMHQSRNPLFGALSEDQRQKILRDAANSNQHEPQREAGTRRSKRISKEKRSQHHQTSHQQELSYSSFQVKHVRNDLEQIRNQRSGEGTTGCTCRKMHVYLPNTHNSTPAGKRNKGHRRMPERKVKEELRKRGLLHGPPDNCLSREQYEQKLYDAVQNEPCCWGDECPCLHSGIGCQADTCSCWHPSHDKSTSNKTSPTSSSSTDTIRNRCGNRYGMYVVDFDAINSHRKQFICQEIVGNEEKKKDDGDT